MPEHPQVSYDVGLIDEVASSLDLRVPNQEALDIVAQHFDAANGEPFEVICDLATGVGKTYLAAGLIEYLSLQGIRNFVFVVPNRTILTKTQRNFTPGDSKDVSSGMQANPYVVTIDNFNTGATASALEDDNLTKLFIFTVQSLIKPDKTTRKAHESQEWLGLDLYQYLSDAQDLVVIADEYHLYSEKAKAFRKTIQELNAMATVGLTATPPAGELDKVVYHYPLIRAIADRYVKTPVIVGRRDAATDIETRLRDGLILLEAKQRFADVYADSQSVSSVNAVMLVVAPSVEAADEIAEMMRRPGFSGADLSEAILVVHSNVDDASLELLARVEEPDSRVRVIINVLMLGVGWDVKNIFVIAPFRASVSEVLTEQTLGRGLRLPFGHYTGHQILDTVEILAHERYADLLKNAGVYLEGEALPKELEPIASASFDPLAGGGASSTPGALADATPGAGWTGAPEAGTPGIAAGAPGQFDPVPVQAREWEEYWSETEGESLRMTSVAAPYGKVVVPTVVRIPVADPFNLSTVEEAPFRDLGSKLASLTTESLKRVVIDVVEDPSSPSGFSITTAPAEDAIAASVLSLPLGGVQRALEQGIQSFDFVPSSNRASLNAISRLVNAVIEGAGGEEALAPHLTWAIKGSRTILETANRSYRSQSAGYRMEIGETVFAPRRLTDKPVNKNRYGPFSKADAYQGWKKSLMPLEWFDSEPERAFANLVDDDGALDLWARMQRSDRFVIEWEGGNYHPDFYVESQGTKYLVEVKSDRDETEETVVAKRRASEAWARAVTDSGDFGTWKYLLVPQRVVEQAGTFAALVQLTN